MYLTGFYISILGQKMNYKDEIKKYTFIEQKNTVEDLDSDWNVITISSAKPNHDDIIQNVLKVNCILETESRENKLLGSLIFTVKKTGDTEKETVPITVMDTKSTDFNYKSKKDIDIILTHIDHRKQIKKTIKYADILKGKVLQETLEMNFFDDSYTETLIVKMQMIKNQTVLSLREYNQMEA